MIQRIDVGDSSDDEMPQPMKFSALTTALLESEAPEHVSPIKKDFAYRDVSRRNDASQPTYAREDRHQFAGLDTPSRAPLLKIIRKASPASTRNVVPEDNPSIHRIMQVGDRTRSTPDSAKRTVSISRTYPHVARSLEGTTGLAYTTPAPAPRAVRVVRDRSASNASMDKVEEGAEGHRSANEDQSELHDVRSAFKRSASAASSDAGSRYVPSTLARSRNTSAESAAPPGSMRIKRLPVGSGSFLRGAPVRRGFRRRESEENPGHEEETQADDAQHNHDTSQPATQNRADSALGVEHVQEAISVHDFERERHASHASRPPTRQSSTSQTQHVGDHSYRSPSRQSKAESLRGPLPEDNVSSANSRPTSHAQPSALSHPSSRENILLDQVPKPRPHHHSASISSYAVPPPKIAPDTIYDQENVPPPTFKRNKDHDFKSLAKSEKVLVLGIEKHRTVADTPVPVPYDHSPRKALGALSENTPLRPAPPPPPKMTVLDAATKTAGASTTKSKKRRQHILVNGKLFTQMNKLGKGGSSDVYCVMAENYKLFALKKVKLEDCDETAVRGYKGEIDLLQKLVDVDRVVRLFDWELDESKQTLSVLMEKGDNDFNRILTQAINSIDSTFDPVMTRFYWKEMLECVQSVHEHDIVHSDLKPANFLMIAGKLKLIDFGIANAIDIDNTVNVHRDSHIGTPNYMSPESITDTNAPVPGSERTSTDPRTGRMMKLGKPSDVWSLGCILYQMTYGRPPFAHIANQISRIMAITNHRVVIEYPSTGVGGVSVPATLRGTLRRCLQRDPSLRPTVAQLLSQTDSWLYPEANNAVSMTEELLGQIIGKVVERCRDPKRGVPSEDEVRQYPASFMAKIREMVEREGVV